MKTDRALHVDPAASLLMPSGDSRATARHAGDFLTWLAAMRSVLRGEGKADVPCDGCVGCCVSSYPIPLRPGDRVALELVPDRYLQWPRAGSMARMGFREDGSCPMLLEGRCTIYAARPGTCRDYDCRIYTATGLVPDGERPVIQARVAEWHFTFDGEPARRRAVALRRAAAFIRANASRFPGSRRAHAATAAAVMAVKVHELFEDATQRADESGIAAMVVRIEVALDAFDNKKGPEGPCLQHP